jgi:hypothetical protein
MLSAQADKLLRYIVGKISDGDIIADHPRTYLTYKGCHDDLDLSLHGPTYGISLLNHGLSEIAEVLRDNGEPAISSLIVNKEDSLPGKDYFRFHSREVEDYEWWLSQARISLTHDWDRVIRNYGRL